MAQPSLLMRQIGNCDESETLCLWTLECKTRRLFLFDFFHCQWDCSQLTIRTFACVKVAHAIKGRMLTHILHSRLWRTRVNVFVVNNLCGHGGKVGSISMTVSLEKQSFCRHNLFFLDLFLIFFQDVSVVLFNVITPFLIEISKSLSFFFPWKWLLVFCDKWRGCHHLYTVSAGGLLYVCRGGHVAVWRGH